MNNANEQNPPAAPASNGRVSTSSPSRPRTAGAAQPPQPSAPQQPRDQKRRAPLPGRLRRPRFWIVMAILLALNGLLAPLLFPEPQDRITVPYTFFKQQVADGNVASITSRGEAIQGMFKRAVQDPTQTATTSPKTSTKFATQSPTFAADPTILPLLDRANVVITAEPLEEPRSTWLTLLLSFGPAILLIGGFLWLSARTAGAAGGGLFAFGRSRARRYQASDDAHPITFADVAGIDEAEHDLIEIVDFLKHPDKYQRLGGRMPRGVLLIGPPGAGKTLLARAVAGEANVPFFSMSGSEFIEMVVGVGAARVRDLFAEARKAAPSIIFVDELDAIGRRRGAGNVIGGHDEREQTLNQLLIEMDGFDTREVVIVLAATNRADVLDPALLRPGRFDRRVVVQPPDRAGRAAILKVHTRSVPLAPGTGLNRVAAETPGLVGADLRNLVNEAALLAAQNGHDSVGMTDFEDALTRIALGAERRLVLSAADRQRVAIHESGHALLGLLQSESDPVRRVTIVPRGQALGVTLSVPDDDRYNYSEAYLRARIVNALGGRVAEELLLGTITTGAENDIKQATELARAMVTRFGMSQEVGLLSLSGTEEGNFLEQGLIGGNSRPYGEGTADAIDHATRQIIDECYAKARALLAQNQDRLEALAAALLRAESLDEAEMRRVTGLGELQAPVDALVLEVPDPQQI
jgi:cell division protease FtsH